MRKISILFLLTLASCQSTFYVVRHAEKVDNSSDAALSEVGKQRANVLKDLLLTKKISKIYSTDFTRTRNTALPLAQAINVPILIYKAQNQKVLIDSLKKVKAKNILIVGHSNTVRYVVNGLFEKDTLRKDLAENEFENLFIVKRGKSKRQFYAQKYGLTK